MQILNRRTLVKLELIITVLLLLYFSDGLDSLKPLEKILAAGSYGIIPILVFSRWKKFLYFSTRDVALILLTILALISVVWSESPEATLRNGRALIRITCFGIYFAARYHWKEQLKLVACALGISAVLALLIGIIIPSTGISASHWRGGFPHKNYLARTMVISTAASLVISLSYNKYRKPANACIILSVILILLTQGKTALVQTIFLVTVLIPLCKMARQSYKPRTLVLVLVLPAMIIGGFFFSANFERIAVEVFNKTDSLTGRKMVLEIVWNHFIWQNPIIGYGYYGFWRSRYDEVAVEMSRGSFTDVWVPDHAHSGFTDLCLSLGFLGLTIFLASAIIAYLRSLFLIGSCKTLEGTWPFLLLTFFFASNWNVNNTILSSKELLWPLYVSTTISLALESERARRKTYGATNQSNQLEMDLE